MIAVFVVIMAENEVLVHCSAIFVNEVDVVDEPVKRLVLFDLREQLRNGIILLVGTTDFLGLLAVLHCHPSVFALEFVVFDFERFGNRNRTQRKV